MQNKGKSLAVAMSVLMLAFYIVIVEYILFAILKIDACKNFIAGMTFETMGIVLLFVVVIGNVIKRENIKIGYFAPIIMCTIVYTIVLDCLNFVAILTMTSPMFFLAHLVLLFIYLMFVVPMYIMGKQ